MWISKGFGFILSPSNFWGEDDWIERSNTNSLESEICAANYNRSTQSTWNSRRAKCAWESIFKDLLGTDVQLVLPLT